MPADLATPPFRAERPGGPEQSYFRGTVSTLEEEEERAEEIAGRDTEQVAALVSQFRLSDACQDALKALLKEARAEPARSRSAALAELDPVLSFDPRLPPPDVLASIRLEGAGLLMPAPYFDLGCLGRGGMGEVRRVWDSQLRRVMAMKIIHSGAISGPANRLRFVEEAQATAQLQHPGIVPVHAIGNLPDGRCFFTMKEVRGVTLQEVIQAVHRASPAGEWGSAFVLSDGPPWTFRRLIEAFQKVAEAVAYAHSRGVYHRDLKPANVMVGSFGEVLVMDWGLARIGSSEGASRPEPRILTTRGTLGNSDLAQTLVGTVAGTPAYMPPEQAAGELHRLGARADVYSLGALLYEILSGRPPYTGPDAYSILRQVLSGPPPPPGRLGLATYTGETVTDEAVAVEPFQPTMPGPAEDDPRVSEELKALCLKAMARDPKARFADAGELARAIGEWQEGDWRREQALREIAAADAILPEIAHLRQQAESLRASALEELARLKPLDGSAARRDAWAREDEARRLERLADLQTVEYGQLLQGALTFVRELPEAHSRLAAHYLAQHQAAEREGDGDRAAQLEVLLRTHDRGAHAAYLKGDGQLSLVVEPSGASLELYRYLEQDRRLVAQPMGPLGRAPLDRHALPMGSYLIKIRARGRQTGLYPVSMSRQERWTGIRPGGESPVPIRLLSAAELDSAHCYVPAGPCWVGGDAQAFNAMPRRRVWVDAFVMTQHPVTNGEYLDFLNALIAEGLEEEALRFAPRLRAGPAGGEGALFFSRRSDGTFELGLDHEGDPIQADVPVLLVDWEGARSYADWQAECTRLPWRLPTELEWEKAARGVDGRYFPWGDFADASWLCVLESSGERARPVPVTRYPEDVSPYGIRGLAGNVREWCADAYRREGPVMEQGLVQPAADPGAGPRTPRVIRGGCYATRLANARAACRYWEAASTRSFLVGFRLVRSI